MRLNCLWWPGGDDVKEGARNRKSGRKQQQDDAVDKQRGVYWQPLSDVDTRRVALFETAITAQTVIVVLLYVSFGACNAVQHARCLLPPSVWIIGWRMSVAVKLATLFDRID